MDAAQPLLLGIHPDFEDEESLVLLFADHEIHLRAEVIEAVAAAAEDPEALDSLIAEYFEPPVGGGSAVRSCPRGSRRARRSAQCDRRPGPRLRGLARARALDACEGTPGGSSTHGPAFEGAVEGETFSPAEAGWAIGALIRIALLLTNSEGSALGRGRPEESGRPLLAD